MLGNAGNDEDGPRLRSDRALGGPLMLKKLIMHNHLNTTNDQIYDVIIYVNEYGFMVLVPLPCEDFDKAPL